MRHVQCLLVLGLLSAGRIGQAAPIAPDVAASYLSTTGGSALVVAAGDWDRSLTLAVALEQAIAESAKVDRIENGAFLGDIQALSDSEILARVGGRHFDDVAIVRPGSSAGSAHVRFYDRLGRLTSELDLGADRPAAPRPSELPPPPAVGVPAAPPPVPPPPSSAVDFNEEALPLQRSKWFFETAHLSLRDLPRRFYYTDRRGRQRSYSRYVMVAVQGDAEHVVPWEMFYDLVGRPDLLRGYEQRTITNERLKNVSAITAMLSLPLFLAASATATQDDKRIPYSLAGAGCGLLVLGVTELLIAAFRSPHPVGRAELSELAERYNAAKRQSLPSLSAPPPATPDSR